jgi:biopolymer transport protein ExbD
VEINIVPLVDVALVLLIIFMVTTTFEKTAGMRLQLPTSDVAKPMTPEKRELVIAVANDGSYRWEGAPISEKDLASTLKYEAAMRGVKIPVILQGDRRASHGSVVQAMTLAQQAGFSRLVIATKQEQHGH